MPVRDAPYTALLLADSAEAGCELCGISVLERLLRTLERCGCGRAIILSSAPDFIRDRVTETSPARPRLTIHRLTRSSGAVTCEQLVAAWPDREENLLVLRADVFDERLLCALRGTAAPTALIDSGGHGQICGALWLNHAWASAHDGALDETISESIQNGSIGTLDVNDLPAYSTSLRRELRPYCFPAPLPQNRRRAEKILLNAAQKGTLDLPAHVHAPIENFLVSRLCKTSVTPNQLTLFGNVVAWLATFCFATGALVAGTALALAVGVLDGLDGKQARLKVETSERGKLEHWFDALFELSWWCALAFSLQRSGLLPNAFSYLLLLLGAELIDLAAKGSVLWRRKQLIDELSRFDRVVRLFGGRRNIYIWIFAVGLVFGAPGQAFAVIAWWEALTAAVHLPRAAWIVWQSYRAS
ncbi:MAG: CDP-alcohol phosphatidyltransferase family protein [Verrucomicrobiota bacterium]|nr:CDP-alcohol phosphatidyltransferase family protein [Verrucomicrobiota bacterium]